MKHDLVWGHKFDDGTTTPGEMNRIFESLYMGNLIDKNKDTEVDVHQKIIDMLKIADKDLTYTKSTAIPEGMNIATKIYNSTFDHGESGIFTAKDGTPYLIAVMAKSRTPIYSGSPELELPHIDSGRNIKNIQNLPEVFNFIFNNLGNPKAQQQELNHYKPSA